mmetsp:Transcript_25655/g.60595  ORF Transcript_25655/g.60595 Transcript_25655/m.60595 type:complete len:647 (-) Transcript_25655:233-2173(-)
MALWRLALALALAVSLVGVQNSIVEARKFRAPRPLLVDRTVDASELAEVIPITDKTTNKNKRHEPPGEDNAPFPKKQKQKRPVRPVTPSYMRGVEEHLSTASSKFVNQFIHDKMPKILAPKGRLRGRQYIWNGAHRLDCGLAAAIINNRLQTRDSKSDQWDKDSDNVNSVRDALADDNFEAVPKFLNVGLTGEGDATAERHFMKYVEGDLTLDALKNKWGPAHTDKLDQYDTFIKNIGHHQTKPGIRTFLAELQKVVADLEKVFIKVSNNKASHNNKDLQVVAPRPCEQLPTFKLRGLPKWNQATWCKNKTDRMFFCKLWYNWWWTRISYRHSKWSPSKWWLQVKETTFTDQYDLLKEKFKKTMLALEKVLLKRIKDLEHKKNWLQDLKPQTGPVHRNLLKTKRNLRADERKLEHITKLKKTWQQQYPICQAVNELQTELLQKGSGQRVRAGTVRGNCIYDGKQWVQCWRQDGCKFSSQCSKKVTLSFTCTWRQDGTRIQQRVEEVLEPGRDDTLRDTVSGCSKCSKATDGAKGVSQKRKSIRRRVNQRRARRIRKRPRGPLPTLARWPGHHTRGHHHNLNPCSPPPTGTESATHRCVACQCIRGCGEFSLDPRHLVLSQQDGHRVERMAGRCHWRVRRHRRRWWP